MGCNFQDASILRVRNEIPFLFLIEIGLDKFQEILHTEVVQRRKSKQGSLNRPYLGTAGLPTIITICIFSVQCFEDYHFNKVVPNFLLERA